MPRPASPANTDPVFSTPRWACDCHVHVFGNPARFPPAPMRAYDPVERQFGDYQHLAISLGLQRLVLVQPSCYGSDNSCLLEVLRAHPQTCRAVAVIDEATRDADLAAMADWGVRGIRLNLFSNGKPDAATARAQLRRAALRVRPLEWHIQIFSTPAMLAELAPVIPDLGVDVVIDHMGGLVGTGEEAASGVQALLDLLVQGRCWVKLSGIDRIWPRPTDYHRAVPLIQAMIAANPAHVVWGSDWPHTVSGNIPGQPKPMEYRAVDDAALLNVLNQAVPDAAQRHRILVENPAALYGFSATE